MGRHVGERGERRGRHGEDTDRQPVEPVGEVDRVGRADEEDDGEGDVEPAEIRNQPLEEREDQPRAVERRFVIGQ